MNEKTGQSWFSKLRNDLKSRGQEAGVVTYATPVTDVVVDTAQKIGNRAGEIGVGIQGQVGQVAQMGVDAIGQGITNVGRAGEEVGGILQNKGENARQFAKSIGNEVVDIGVFTESTGTKTSLREKAKLLIDRNAYKIGTIVDERILPWVKRLDNKPGKSPSEIQAEITAETQLTQKTSESDVAAYGVVEGQTLIDVVGKNFKAGIEFDQLKDRELGALIEKMMGGTDVAAKLGKVLVRQVIAVVLETSNIGGQTGSARDAMSELQKDPEVLAKLNDIKAGDLLKTIDDALKLVSESRKNMMESRGENKNLSWKYEANLAEQSERAQHEMAGLSQEILKMLPEQGTDITPGVLATARAKGFEYGRKANEAMRHLRDIALSLEKRFPNQAAEIQAKVNEIKQQWLEAKAVIPAISGQFLTENVRQESQKLIGGLINENASLRALTPDGPDQSEKSIMQQAALAAIGAEVTTDKQETLTALGVHSAIKEMPMYDAKPGSLYARAIEALSEYTALTQAYEVAREQVKEHPEAADRLFVLADRIVQAKYAYMDLKSQIDATLMLEVRNAKNVVEIQKLQQENRAEEAKTKQVRSEYYTKMLDQAKARWQRELPTIKKFASYAVLAGAAGVGVMGYMEYREPINAVANQINTIASQMDALKDAAWNQTWETAKQAGVDIINLVQHAVAEIFDRFDRLDTATKPLSDAIDLIGNAAEAAGVEQVKNFLGKSWPYLAGLGAARVVLSGVDKLGSWALGKRAKGSEAAAAAAPEIALTPEQALKKVEIDKLKEQLALIEKMKGLEETASMLTGRISILEAELEVMMKSVESAAPEMIPPVDSSSTATNA